MVVHCKTGLMCWARIAFLISVLLSGGCRERAQPNDSGAKAAGEPEQYSATVVRIVEEGTNRETFISREARSGELRREEWTEHGQKHAVIWRPDIAKGFLLDLDRRVYIEIGIGAAPLPESRAGELNPEASASDQDAKDSTVQAIDRYFSDAQLPLRVETQTLSPAIIDGHRCVVDQQRAIFPDGHTEITRRFHAPELSGLLLRVESETEQGRTRVITERRDIRIAVAPDTFSIPADFKRVKMLPR